MADIGGATLAPMISGSASSHAGRPVCTKKAEMSQEPRNGPTGVFAILPDFDFPLNYTVTGFSILYTDTRGDFEEPSSSSTLTPKQKDLINRLTRGKSLIIKDIKALGPDGKIKDLGVLLFKIQ
jgi:hypothetical protein